MGIESTPFQTLVDALTTELLSTVNSSDEQGRVVQSWVKITQG